MGKKVYVMCGGRNLYEGMTKEEIIRAIAEATGNVPTLSEDAFITQIVNQKDGGNLKFWRGTRAEYNALTIKDQHTFYIITDDANPDESFAVYLHKKTGTVHALTCSGGGNNIKFVATDAYAAGDTFTVNGVEVAAQTPDGQPLTDGFFVAGAVVNCFLNGDTVNFKGGGGIRESYRIYLDSATQEITKEQYLEAMEAVKNGRAVYLDINGDLYGYIPKAQDIETEGTGDLWVVRYAMYNGAYAYLDYRLDASTVPSYQRVWRKLFPLTNPAGAGNIMTGYKAYDDIGREIVGTGNLSHVQTGYQKVAEQTGAVHINLTATGSTIDSAVIYLSETATGDPLLQVGAIHNGAIVAEDIGGLDDSIIQTISGNVITVRVADEVFEDYGDVYLRYTITSH